MRMKGPLLTPRRPTPRDVADRLYELRVPLGLSLLALLLAMLGWWGYRTWQARQEDAAQFLVTQALEAGETTPGTKGKEEAEQDLAKAGKEALQLLQKAREHYPRTAAAEQALLQIGNVHYRQGEYPDAVQAYQNYLEQYPSGPWVLLAALGKGYALEAQGRYEDAATTFRAFAEAYTGSSLRVEALMGLARSLSELKRAPEALEVYQRVTDDYPGTPWALQAQRQMASLKR